VPDLRRRWSLAAVPTQPMARCCIQTRALAYSYSHTTNSQCCIQTRALGYLYPYTTHGSVLHTNQNTRRRSYMTNDSVLHTKWRSCPVL
jgi:hypothetical protein